MPSTMAACAAHPLVPPPRVPPVASQRPECLSAATSRACESACAPSSCAAGDSHEFRPRLRSQRNSPAQHLSSSAGRRLFAHDLRDRNGSFVGQHAESCEANAPVARAEARACAHLPRSAHSSPAGGSRGRLPAHELPAKRRADGCAAAGPYEHAPRPQSAHCSPADGGGRRLYARAREQSRRNEIRRALHFNLLFDTR